MSMVTFMSETATEPKVEQITVRMTEAEKEKASALGKFLYVNGKLDEASIAGALRAALNFTVNEIAKDVEARRLGAQTR